MKKLTPKDLAKERELAAVGRLQKFYKALNTIAHVFSQLQQLRIDLLGEGTKAGMIGTKEGNAIVRLGQMLEKGKGAMKEDFTKVTGEF